MITATVETRENYLTHEYGVKSWLLTQDHKRIALLYLGAISFFFFLKHFRTKPFNGTRYKVVLHPLFIEFHSVSPLKDL